MDAPDAPALTTVLDELQRDGLLRRRGARYETTAAWRGARRRASRSEEAASDRNELTNPIVQTLLAFYGVSRALPRLSVYVAVLFALEVFEGQPAR